uniref:Fucosyltransferase N-terminal domain-containing protein n=1 Tax=Ciona savignyi TaxID=51511 RepID=H2YU21_CIOSA
MVSEFINGDWVANNNGFTIDSQTCGRCKITYDRKVVAKSDAVVFHAVDMDSNDLPLKRLSKQSYVWWMAESSSTIKDVSYPDLHHYFNLTMTVRRSSDIHTPYNSFQWLLKMLWKKKRGKDLVRMVAEMREVYLTPDEIKKYI